MPNETVNVATEAVEAAADAVTNRCKAGLWFTGGFFMGAAALGAIQLTIKVISSRNKKAEVDFDEDDDEEVDVTVNNNEDK